jgi:hypothetical protein
MHLAAGIPPSFKNHAWGGTLPLACASEGPSPDDLIMSHNSATGHWFSLDLGGSQAFCHSRAWLPREESRVFLAETSPCVSVATEPAPRTTSDEGICPELKSMTRRQKIKVIEFDRIDQRVSVPRWLL